MKDRVVYEWPAERRRMPLSKWMSWVMALVLTGAFIGAWACAPGKRTPGSTPVAAASFLAPAPAQSQAQQAPPPAALQPASLPAPPSAEQAVSEATSRLAAALAAARESAADARAEAAAARAEAAARGFPVAGRVEMSSTMYCLKGHMRTGVRTRDGMAAGDPRVLPLGSVVRVSHPDGRPIGIFVIMDTGGAIKGNKIDLYVDSCPEAVRWGRRPVVTEVLAIGRASPGDLR